MKSLFEQNSGTYCKQGDYFITNLILSESKENSIGIYDQRFNLIVNQMKATHGITEQLRADNPMVWVMLSRLKL